MRRLIGLTCCLLWLAGGSAQAAGAGTPPSSGYAAPAAVVARPQTLVDLSDTEERLVTRDRLEVSLALEREAADPAAAQSALNQKMKSVLAIAAKASNVQVETRGYAAMPVGWAKPGGAVTLWRSEETIALIGTSFGDVLRLTGRLQKEGLAVRDMAYAVTSARRRRVARDLTSEALKDLAVKAAAAAQDLGLKFLYWSHVTVGAANRSGPRPLAMMTARGAASAEFPAPVGAAGLATISVSVSGTAVLGPLH